MMRRYCVVLVGVVGGALFAPAANTTANAEPVYRRWTGASNVAWNNSGNWDPADVPSTSSEAALFDGSNNQITTEVSGQTIGQLRVVSPSTSTQIKPVRDGTRSLTLSPALDFSDIGIDMSAATVDFAFRNYSDSSSRWLNLNLASSQQWDITSTSLTGGDLISLIPTNGGSGPVRVNLGANTLTTNIGVGRKIDTAYMDFRSTTGGSLVKTGAGTLELRRPNSYNGDTTIQSGTVKLISSGSINNSPTIIVGDAGSSGAVLDVSTKTGGFSVLSTQTLMGIGTVTGSFSVADGGTLAPGASAGTLTVNGDLTLADGALLDFELASIGASDMVSMSSGTLTLNGQEWDDFTFTPLSGFGAGDYTLFDAGTISGSLGSTVSGTIGSLEGNLWVDSTNSNLMLTVVPEPGGLPLAALGMLGLLGAIRRRTR